MATDTAEHQQQNGTIEEENAPRDAEGKPPDMLRHDLPGAAAIEIIHSAQFIGRRSQSPSTRRLISLWAARMGWAAHANCFAGTPERCPVFNENHPRHREHRGGDKTK
jgi:hypothetical protein